MLAVKQVTMIEMSCRLLLRQLRSWTKGYFAHFHTLKHLHLLGDEQQGRPLGTLLGGFLPLRRVLDVLYVASLDSKRKCSV